MVISFAATTLDTATRIQRLIITELGSAIKIKILQNRYIATSLAIIPAIVLTLWSTKDPSTGSIKEAAWILWPIFGASNQMLAALTLLVICLYFWKRGYPDRAIFESQWSTKTVYTGRAISRLGGA